MKKTSGRSGDIKNLRPERRMCMYTLSKIYGRIIIFRRNFPGGSLMGENIPSGNFLGRNFPVKIFWVKNFRGNIFIEPLNKLLK